MPATVEGIIAGNAIVTLDLKTVGTWGRKVQQQAARLKSAAMQMGTAAIVMAAPFVAGTKVYADFSKEMAFVATMLDEPQKHMGDFTKGVRQLSVEFGESTSKLARGLYDILSAGFAPAKALEMLAVTTRAAKAGMADASQATAAIIAVLNSYGLSAEHASYVSDVLFQTVRYGVLTFGELAGHIGLVASTAAQAGVSLEDMGAVLAIITRGGVEMSHAVVALNNILKAFLMPTGAGADFAKKLKEAGLDFELSAKSLEKIGLIGAFRKIANLSTAQLSRLFPTIRAGRGVFAMKAGWLSLLEIISEFYNPLGATERAMNEVAKSFGFLVDRVKQGALLIASHIGEAVAGSVTELGEKVIKVALGFGEWIKINKELIVNAAKLIVALGGLAVTLLIVAKAMAVVGTVMAVMAGPAGIAKLIAGVITSIAVWNLMGLAIGNVKKEMQEIQRLGAKEATKGEGKRVKRLQQEILTLKGEISDEEAQVAARGKHTYDDLKKTAWRSRMLINWHAEDVAGLLLNQFDAIKAIPVVSGKFMKSQFRQPINKFAIENQLKYKNHELRMLQIAIDKEKVLQKQTDLMNDQVTAMQSIAGIGQRIQWAGYWHTPHLISASYGSGDQSEEAALLADIKINTSNDGAIVQAIKEASPVVQ